MSAQAQGFVGRIVATMIRRTVRAQFHTVYWTGARGLPAGPVVFACNHFGWHDGYLMFHVAEAAGKRSVDWMDDLGAFPLFRAVGALPMPPDDPAARTATLRQTVRLLREGVSLVHFPEGRLHRGPRLGQPGGVLPFLARTVGPIRVVPTAITYEMSVHQRPEAYVDLLPSVTMPSVAADAWEDALSARLAERRLRPGPWPDDDVLAHGTPDVNEKWDWRKSPWGGS